ncbi:hypothetical protein GCM10010177_14810 [Actinomadura citrea]|nr:hypothetical protein GCM10010177_14810 [Actinomadura citrea]
MRKSRTAGIADGSAQHPVVIVPTRAPQAASATARRRAGESSGLRAPARARLRPRFVIDTLHRLLNRAAAAFCISRSASRLAMAWRLS